MLKTQVKAQAMSSIGSLEVEARAQRLERDNSHLQEVIEEKQRKNDETNQELLNKDAQLFEL